MSSSENSIAIEVRALSKTYRIWRDPKARLKAPLLHTMGSVVSGLPTSLLQSIGRRLLHRAENYSREFYALRQVSFRVEKGEAVGIVGLNGSGKSSLLQVLAGVLKPTAGSVCIEGRVAALLELGAGFNGEFTGRENAYLNASILGISRKEMDRRFPQIEEFAEIGAFMDQPVKTYSSGMAVRLAFSILTQIDPDVLIIDEALSVGDAYFQHKCGRKIREFRDRGKTLLFVSHDLGAVKSLCDRALLLENGMLIREGPAESVIDYYNAIIARKQKDEEIRQVELEMGRTVTRSGDSRAEIVRIELLDAQGNPGRAFVSGSPATVEATIRFNEAVSKPTFGILLRDRLGVDVFGTNTYYNGPCGPPAVPGSVQVVKVRLELRLGPGSYSITVAVHRGAEHTETNYDWIDHALVFEVLPCAGRHFIGMAALPCSIEWQAVNSHPEHLHHDAIERS